MDVPNAGAMVATATRASPHEELPAIGLLRLNLLRSRVIRRLARLRGGKRDSICLGTGSAEELFSKWVFCVGSSTGRALLQQVDAVVPHAAWCCRSSSFSYLMQQVGHADKMCCRDPFQTREPPGGSATCFLKIFFAQSVLHYSWFCPLTQ